MIFTILLQLLGLSPVLTMTPVTKDLLTPITAYGEGCGYSSCPVMGQNVLNVHIVPSTHAELGYSRTFYEHFTGYEPGLDYTPINMKNILDNIITGLWTNERRKFTFSDMPYLFHWWKNRDMTVRRMVYQLLRQGRLFFVGGGWSMSDEATTSYHAIIEHFTYNLRKLNATFLECGRPLVTWQADVFGHSKEFASLMAQMGFDGHFINPISFDDELTRMKSKSLEFVWRGSDDLGSDTDIYTHKLFDGYWSPPGFCFGSMCNDPLIVTTDLTFRNVEERVETFIQQMQKRQGPYYSTKHIMVMMGKRFGFHDAQLWFANIDKLIANVNSRQRPQKQKIYLFYSTPACYLRAVHESAPLLATKQDDFYPFTYDKDTHSSGAFTSRPVVKYIARETHLFLQMAKHLRVFGQLEGKDQQFEEIMWIHGVIQDHTIITGASRPHVIEYFTRKAFLAKKRCLQIYRQAFNTLRNSPKKMIYYACQHNMSSCWNIQGNRFYIVIYNPLAWPVTIPVRLPVARGIYNVFDPQGVKQNHSIVTIPELVMTLPGRGEVLTEDELVFIAEKLPPMGFRSYYVDQIKVMTRYKRSIIKKLHKNSKNKKYLTRQTNNMKIDDKSLLDDIPDYEYFEEATENPNTVKSVQENKALELELYSDNLITQPISSSSLEEDQNSTRKMDVFSSYLLNTTTTTTTTAPSTSTPTRTTITTRPPVVTTQTMNSPTKPAPANNIVEYYDDENEPVISTTPFFDFETYYRRMEKSGYHSSESSDNFIKNEYIQINFDAHRKLSNIVLSNGVSMAFDVQMCYYVSDEPDKLDTGKKKPGAYIFRPIDAYPILIRDFFGAKVLKTDIVQELQIRYSNYAGLTFKLYKGLPTIEVDWVVGPIPSEDKLGKDVFVRYTTDVQNGGAFYTDSNGRQTIKRMRDSRATYTPVVDTGESGIASNTYPVTSKFYIEDLQKNIRFSIFTDRAQGGTSLVDGNVDMMLHRRIFTDDAGIGAVVNETEYDKGLIVRGKHHLYISKADYRPNKVFEKKFAKELELQPTVFSSIHESYYNITYEEWHSEKNEYSGLKTKLPVGVHILTLEQWGDKLLLRLENYLEKSDVVRNGLKKVFIQELFKDFKITGAKETTLSGNMWLEDHVPLQWKTDKYVKNFNEAYSNNSNIEFSADQGGFIKPTPVFFLNQGIELKPQQIRTFIYIQINFDAHRKLSNIVLSNGVSMAFDVQMCYYVSDEPDKLDTGKKKPGAYIFRPIDAYPILIRDFFGAKVLKTDIVQELQIRYSNYAGLTFKLYKGLPTIEVDWVVGPIPSEDKLGKDVFVRYTTDVQNGGAFYTDSNGRQTIKRMRDSRATYTPVVDTGESGIASNTYPVTSKFYIEDLQKNIRFSIFTDRAQGGTSLVDGNVDMMLHRRIFTDDAGIGAVVNETEYDKGLIVRGKHHLYISKADYRPNKVFEKKFAKELELQPTVFSSIHESYYNITYEEWHSEKNEYSGLKTKLPVGVHILTLEQWGDKLLLRLENYLEKSDVVRNGLKKVFIQELFKDFKITGAKETTLSGNMWLEDHVPLQWKTDKYVKNFNEAYSNNSNIEFSADQGGFIKPTPVFFLNQGIELKPQQIRTFIVSYIRR